LEVHAILLEIALSCAKAGYLVYIHQVFSFFIIFAQGMRMELGGAMARFWQDIRMYFNLTEENRWCNIFEKKQMSTLSKDVYLKPLVFK